MTASARTAVCLDCRVLVAAGDRCEINTRHHVVDLAQPSGRDALRTAVWNAPRIRRYVTPETRVLVAGLVGVGLIATALAFGPWGALIAFLAIIVMPALMLGGLALINRSYRSALPRGTTSHMLLPPRRSERGIAHADGTIEAPLSGRACIAFVVCYKTTQYYGGDVMLVDCATAGFAVGLDDGRTVQIPPGPIRLEVATAQAINDNARIQQHLAGISSHLDTGSERAALPFDVATEGLLVDGDRIELCCKLGEVALSYRETSQRLVPTSLPRVRVLALTA